MRRVPLVLLAVLSLAAGACGGDDGAAPGGSTTSATQAATGTQAAGRAEAGCREVAQPKPKADAGRRKPTLKLDRDKTYTAVLRTSCGSLEIRLAVDRAPKTAASFVSLARSGFYDGLAFHRIVPGFVVQGGDPKGTGEGGPGYSVTEAPPDGLRYTRGTVAMAKAEQEPPGTSGSQFFIVTAPDAGLRPDYALLGRVVEGDDVVTRLDEVPNDPTDNRPTQPVVIEDVTIRGS